MANSKELNTQRRSFARMIGPKMAPDHPIMAIRPSTNPQHQGEPIPESHG